MGRQRGGDQARAAHCPHGQPGGGRHLGGGPVQYPGDQDRAGLAREAAQKQTDSIIESGTAESRPTQVTVEAVTGFPAEELLRASAGADMVVVGSRGAGGFRRLRGMGSVANQLTHHAHCPVVVIPDEEA